MKSIIPLNKIIIEPYRLFFPIGLIYLLLSVLIWIPYGLMHSDYYPILLHHYLVLDGFMLLFIGGFLMTAVPKFSKAPPARPLELIIFFILPLLGVSDALKEHHGIYLISFLQSLFLLQFMVLRISKRKENPPGTFIFIPLSLIVMAIYSLLGFFDSNYFSIATFFICPMSLIILGIGGRLIPAILGHREIVIAQKKIYEKPLPFLQIVPKKEFIIALIFISSFIIDHWASSFIQFQIVAYFSTRYFKIFTWPKTQSALAKCIFFNCWVFILGFLLKFIWPQGDIHGLHWIFIGVFLNLAILIATRVCVSHGKGSNELENSKFLYAITGLIFLAMTTRVSAFILEGLYESHIGYSAFLIIVSIGLWIFKYGRYILSF